MNYSALTPQIILVMLALGMLVLDLIIDSKQKRALIYFAVGGLLAVIVTSMIWQNGQQLFFYKMLSIDSFASFFTIFFAAAGILIVLISSDWIKQQGRLGEYYTMLMFALLGLTLIAAAVELITIYIALELASLSLYVLVTRAERDKRSSEAGLKYLILSAFSTMVLLYGISLLYGLTGTTYLSEMGVALGTLTFQPAIIPALVFLLAGFGFKIALVPFHMWVPDTYEGAPTPITAFLATASKAAGLALVARIFLGSLLIVKNYWVLPLAILAALTMSLGNLVALVQTNIKRMLAYSGIAQAGYILVGLVALSKNGLAAVLVYLVAYGLTAIGAFTAVIIFSRHTGSDEIADYAGLYKRAPGLAFGMTVCMLSLAGLPLFAGFMAKFYTFLAAFNKGYYWLVVIALINSAISLYYYIMVVKEIYASPAKQKDAIPWLTHSRIVFALTTLGVLVIGVYPTLLIDYASRIVTSVFSGLP